MKNKSPLREDAFGTCAYTRTSPARELLGNTTKILNIHVNFDEALKLSLAIDECVRKLNRYNRAFKAGKAATMTVAVHLDGQRISIHETG